MNAVLFMAGVVLASAPFVFRLQNHILLLAFIVAYAVFLLLGRAIEASLGQVAVQGWAFYAVTFLLFVVAGFPAFVWRYLWHKNA